MTAKQAHLFELLSKKQGKPSGVDRVHRHVIVSDYGKPIHKASFRAAMIAALEGFIEEYESLRTQSCMLQCDVSIDNLMMNEEDDILLSGHS
jgi:hypothetical protein